MYTVVITSNSNGQEVNKFTTVTAGQYDEVLEVLGALPKE